MMWMGSENPGVKCMKCPFCLAENSDLGAVPLLQDPQHGKEFCNALLGEGSCLADSQLCESAARTIQRLRLEELGYTGQGSG